MTNSEGNHGEDVKEYYFYIDSTPTHSYMKYLYKYPQREYPYRDLVETNKRRSREEMEYELLDTGIFDDDRYFDVFVEYAKADPEDLLIKISVHNRGPEAAQIHLLPTLWFRNVWSWGDDEPKGTLRQSSDQWIAGLSSQSRRVHPAMRGRSGAAVHRERIECQPAMGTAQSFAVREGRFSRIRRRRQERRRQSGQNRNQGGCALCARCAGRRQQSRASAAERQAVRRRIRDVRRDFRRTSGGCRRVLRPHHAAQLERRRKRVHRQALAGMLWSKQYYYFDLDRWLSEHDSHPLMGSGKGAARNPEWFHMLNRDIISMPDKWEYPWYAAWDLAFHTIALSLVDFDFAKEQLLLMLRSLYAHPNGQIPAYEWNFSDVNPPVHAWATLFLYRIETQLGRADLRFLERSFQGLMLNFNWWVNRKDPEGRNVFAGGFLGLDNIGVFDRSAPLPTGGHLDQADGTAWMGFYCLCMLEIALVLTEYDAMYEDIAFRFLEHFFWIAYAMDRIGEHHDEMWDSADGFFYDLLHFPNGDAARLKIRSMVGLLPVCAANCIRTGHARAPSPHEGTGRIVPQASSGGGEKGRCSR